MGPYNIDPNRPRDPDRHIKALKLYGLAIISILVVFFLINLITKVFKGID